MTLTNRFFFHILFVVFLSVFVAACGGDKDSAQGDTASSDSSASTSAGGYPEEAKEQAVAQCMQSGATKEMCECVTAEIQERISYEEMQQIEKDMQDGKGAPEKFGQISAEAGMACASKQQP